MSVFISVTKKGVPLTESEIRQTLSDMIIVNKGFIQVKPPTDYYEVNRDIRFLDSQNQHIFEYDTVWDKKDKNNPNPKSYQVVPEVTGTGVHLKGEDGVYYHISHLKNKIKKKG